ncbi:MAG: DUF4834 family protein [Tannerella sp.]|nr:DUF4834 family protein [Tannerella sp.]
MKYFIILIFCFFIVPYLIRTVVRYLFGGGLSDENSNKQRRQNYSRSSGSGSSASGDRKKKVIPKEEGEYVDYVEVK